MKQSKAKRRDVSLGERGFNATKRGAVSGVEFVGELPSNAIYSATFPIRYLVKKYGSKKASKMIQDLEDEVGGLEGQLTNVSKKSGVVKELPPPETYSEKVVENLGDIGGGIIAGGPLGSFKSIPRAASTITGALSQAAIQPKVEELAPNSPLMQGVLNTGVGLLGSLTGAGAAKKLQPKSNIAKLPEFTAAQEAPLFSKRSGKLTKKQLDLMAKDPDAARMGSIIQRRQQNKIINEIKRLEKTNGRKVANEIGESFEKFKDNMYSEYRNDRNKLFENLEIKNPKRRFDPRTGKEIIPLKYNPIDTSKTGELIDSIYNSSAANDDVRKILSKMADQIESQKGNPLLLDDLKKSFNDKVTYNPLDQLYLGSRKNSILSQITHEMTEELKEQVPGYSEMLGKFKPRMDHLQELEKSIVGDYFNKAQKKPSELINKMFTNTDDEESVKLLKEVISPQTYEKAANKFLADTVNEAVSDPSWNQKNKANNFFKVRSALEKEKKLDITLPEKQQAIRNNLIKNIQKSEIGVPRNDFQNQIEREVVKGNEAKNVGKIKDIAGKTLPTVVGGTIGALTSGYPGAIAGAGAGAGLGYLGDMAKTRLNRNEMLTGVSPQKQIKKGMEEAGRQGIQQSLIASELNKRPEVPETPYQDKISSSGLKEDMVIPDKKDHKRSIDTYFENMENPQKNSDDSQNYKSKMDDFFSKIEPQQGGREKRKILSITPQRGRETISEMIEED